MLQLDVCVCVGTLSKDRWEGGGRVIDREERWNAFPVRREGNMVEGARQHDLFVCTNSSKNKKQNSTTKLKADRQITAKFVFVSNYHLSLSLSVCLRLLITLATWMLRQGQETQGRRQTNEEAGRRLLLSSQSGPRGLWGMLSICLSISSS